MPIQYLGVFCLYSDMMCSINVLDEKIVLELSPQIISLSFIMRDRKSVAASLIQYCLQF